MSSSNAWASFRRYWQHEGFLNASVLALYKVFPKPFSLLARRLTSGSDRAAFVASDYLSTLSSVEDFCDWSAYGGAAAPIPSGDKRTCIIWFVPDWTNVWG